MYDQVVGSRVEGNDAVMAEGTADDDGDDQSF